MLFELAESSEEVIYIPMELGELIFCAHDGGEGYVAEATEEVCSVVSDQIDARVDVIAVCVYKDEGYLWREIMEGEVEYWYYPAGMMKRKEIKREAYERIEELENLAYEEAEYRKQVIADYNAGINPRAWGI